MNLGYAGWVLAWYFVHFLVMYLQCTGPGHHPLPPVSFTNVCDECLQDMRKQAPLPPRFSLTNNLWVGAVPAKLSSLTFLEQLLIMHLYPQVYIFKLFPKSGGGIMAGLQRGMHGNVRTYKSNVHSMTEMVEGKLMSHPLTVLPSLITIMYIGIGRIPKDWLHSTFRVQHHHISIVLAWLRENNPKYYGDIVISTGKLN